LTLLADIQIRLVAASNSGPSPATNQRDQFD
jgi:hypothetical protein